MIAARRALPVTPFLALIFGLAAAARASGQWYDASVSPVDLASCYKSVGTITGLNAVNKPALIQITVEGEGGDMVLVVPKWVLLSQDGKPIRFRDLRKGQWGTLRWTVIDGSRALASLDIVSPKPPPPLPQASKMPRPAVPRLDPAALAPLQRAQPIAPVMPAQPAPVASPAIQRPITPIAPSTQDLRR
jgi:hypothetical protein